MAVTAPDNDLVVIAADDTTLSTGYSNKLEPENTLLTTGYDKDQAVTAENLNYILNNFAAHIQYCQDLLVQYQLPIGSVYENADDDTDPSTLFGYGTWTPFANGQVLVGSGSFTDIRGNQLEWNAGDVQGEYYHTMTEEELVQHSHQVTGSTKSTSHSHSYSGTVSSNGNHRHGISNNSHDGSSSNGVDRSSESHESYAYTEYAGAHTHTYSGTTATNTHSHTIDFESQNTGSTTPFNVMQPTLAVNRWKRTA